MGRMKTALAALALLGAGWTAAAGEPPPPPEWAGFFSPAEYAEFIRLVREYFASRNVEIVLGDGSLLLPAAAGREERQLGLVNLAQVCHQQEQAAWAGTIAGHFARQEEMDREAAELEGRFHDYEAIAGQLAVRLWPPEFREGVGAENIVCREDLPGVLSVLVYDLPSSIRQVHPDQVAAWGRPVAELFARGLENVGRQPAPELSRVAVDGGVELLLVAGNEFFVATHALLLESRPELLGPQGALVAVPNRHTLLAYPLADSRAAVALSPLIKAARGLEREGPGSISPEVYWYRGGHFTLLPVTEEEGRLACRPPAEFLELLEALPAPSPSPAATAPPPPATAPPVRGSPVAAVRRAGRRTFPVPGVYIRVSPKTPPGLATNLVFGRTLVKEEERRGGKRTGRRILRFSEGSGPGWAGKKRRPAA